MRWFQSGSRWIPEQPLWPIAASSETNKITCYPWQMLHKLFCVLQQNSNSPPHGKIRPSIIPYFTKSNHKQHQRKSQPQNNEDTGAKRNGHVCARHEASTLDADVFPRCMRGAIRHFWYNRPDWSKSTKVHAKDIPWITHSFKYLINQWQAALNKDRAKYQILLNRINHE